MEKNLKYVIIGAGGTGGAIGAHLARAGKNVTLIARGKHLEVMNRQGIKVIKPAGDFVVRDIKAYDMQQYENHIKESQDERPNVIFVCVKGYSLEDTIPFIQNISGQHTVVIPVLNVYGTGRNMQKKLPKLLVTDGCIYVAAELREPGCIFMNGDILRVVFGKRHDRDNVPAQVGFLNQSQNKMNVQDISMDSKEKKTYASQNGGDFYDLILRQVENDLNDSGIRGILSEQIERDTMIKFSYIAAQNTCGTYYGVAAGEIQKEGEIRDCFIRLVREIEILGNAMGLYFSESLVEKNLRLIDSLSPDMTTSMQRDLRDGKQSEIDGLVYSVPDMAREYGVELPVFEKIVSELNADKQSPTSEA